MKQDERRIYLIQKLLKEDSRYHNTEIPDTVAEQKLLLRGLMNVRMPKEATSDFLQIQDDYLKEAVFEKGVVSLKELSPIQNHIYLWQGDITTLAVDAIVNAANRGMTGCYVPNHACIDNCIHTFGGMQMRLTLDKIMKQQGHEESTGFAKITPAYNLPCSYVLHTVGPIIQDAVRKEDEELLSSCYRSCLKLADQHHLKSIAFCCISTGVFHFPNERAAEIAVATVQEYLVTHKNMEVIFNVFKDEDKEIYEQLLR